MKKITFAVIFILISTICYSATWQDTLTGKNGTATLSWRTPVYTTGSEGYLSLTELFGLKIGTVTNTYICRGNSSSQLVCDLAPSTYQLSDADLTRIAELACINGKTIKKVDGIWDCADDNDSGSVGTMVYPGAGVAVSLGPGGWTTSLNITGISDNQVTDSSTLAASTKLAKIIYDLANGKQASDSDLTYLASFTMSANVKSMLEAANYAAIKALLGYPTTGDYQPADSDLTYLAGVVLSNNVKSILNASDYAAIKTLMGYLTSADIVTNYIDGHATGSVTILPYVDNIVHNLDQTANATVTLSAITANSKFSAIAGKTQANYWRIDPNASDKICLIATDGSVTCGADGAYVGLSTVAQGNMLSCKAFKTGTSSYDWLCGGVSGTWVSE